MFTPSERRGAMVVALLLVLGALHDTWRAQPGRGVAPGPTTVLPSPADTPAGGNGHDSSGRSAPRFARDPSPRAGLSLNRASAAELEGLPGIGPVLAGRIVAHREAHGPFTRVEDLLAVRGIGPRLLERLRSHVVIEG